MSASLGPLSQQRCVLCCHRLRRSSDAPIRDRDLAAAGPLVHGAPPLLRYTRRWLVSLTKRDRDPAQHYVLIEKRSPLLRDTTFSLLILPDCGEKWRDLATPACH